MDVDRDPFFLLSLMAPMTMMYAALALLVVPFVLYVIARWRAHRDAITDPQLGIKVALDYFAITAFQVVLAGAMLFIYAILSNLDGKGSLYRMAFGLMMPAGLVLGAHLALLARTNQDRFPSVRRLFAGYNLLLTGLFGFIGLVLAFQMLLKKGPAGELGRIAAAMVLVYGSAWAAVGWRFAQLVLGDESSPSSPSASATPSAPGTIVPSGPSLPSLGGGSFPPIEK
ncbi:MAG: hypothetical protein JWO36_7092 [Myxococcales bacterium]|nr:hypothetical protein [Myxococcales bacterium]